MVLSTSIVGSNSHFTSRMWKFLFLYILINIHSPSCLFGNSALIRRAVVFYCGLVGIFLLFVLIFFHNCWLFSHFLLRSFVLLVCGWIPYLLGFNQRILCKHFLSLVGYLWIVPIAPFSVKSFLVWHLPVGYFMLSQPCVLAVTFSCFSV